MYNYDAKNLVLNNLSSCCKLLSSLFFLGLNDKNNNL
jgi:hypothetical protein